MISSGQKFQHRINFLFWRKDPGEKGTEEGTQLFISYFKKVIIDVDETAV
jgi:hypothetical protein